MAQVKDLLVNGNTRLIGNTTAGSILGNIQSRDKLEIFGAGYATSASDAGNVSIIYNRGTNTSWTTGVSSGNFYICKGATLNINDYHMRIGEDSGKSVIFPGNVSVNTLHIKSSGDVAPTSDSAGLKIGNLSAEHISIDNNEIMALNNKSTSILYLNADGGDVHIGNAGSSSNLTINGKNAWHSGNLKDPVTLSGTQTITGTKTFNAPVMFTQAENIVVRKDNASYTSGMFYDTPGNEAWVFARRNPITSFIFTTDLKLTETVHTGWQELSPVLQIKNQSVIINKLIGNGVTPSYNLEVNGTSCLNGKVTLGTGSAHSISSDGSSYSGTAANALNIEWDNTNHPTFATVATTGSYTDLINKPSLGTASSKSESYFARGTNSNDPVDIDSKSLTNGLYYFDKGTRPPFDTKNTDGALFHQAYSNTWAGQIAQNYRDGQLFVRGLNNNTWKPWYKIWDTHTLPSPGTSNNGKVLKANSDGTVSWQTDNNTWRSITNDYGGTDTAISLSQKGANDLYNELHNGYAESSGVLSYGELSGESKINEFIEAKTLKACVFSGYKIGDILANNGMILSLGYSTGSYGHQLAMDDDGPEIYTRGLSNTKWTKWEKIWHSGNLTPVTGVKGNNETSYRAGNVNITCDNIGAAASSHGTHLGDVTNGRAANRVLKRNSSDNGYIWADDANSWRPITNSYSGSETGTSLSQKGANDLYTTLNTAIGGKLGSKETAINSDQLDGHDSSEFAFKTDLVSMATSQSSTKGAPAAVPGTYSSNNHYILFKNGLALTKGATSGTGDYFIDTTGKITYSITNSSNDEFILVTTEIKKAPATTTEYPTKTEMQSYANSAAATQATAAEKNANSYTDSQTAAAEKNANDYVDNKILNLKISKSASADMSFASENPNIEFSENGSQPVKLMYTDYDAYRSPAGLKVVGGAEASPAWFEAEGDIYGASVHAKGDVYGASVHGAVWNDYSDSIEVPEKTNVVPGYCYVTDGKNYNKSSKYCQKGIIGIQTDTYGMSVGKKGNQKELDISVSGFVLAYVDKEYSSGTPLTCTKDGKLTKIKWYSKLLYPERVVGTFWKVEPEEEWGPQNRKVKVNGRYWIKIK